MAVHLRIAVRTHPPDGWLVTLVPPDNWAVVGTVLDRPAVETLIAAAREWRPAPRRVAQPDEVWVRRERDAGRALATIWRRTPELAAAWGHALGFARGRGEPLVVHLETGDPAARGLPWELVAADGESEPLERLGLGLVNRLRPGPEVPAPDGPLTVAAWCPTPDDPVCAAVLDHLAERAAAAGAGPVRPAALAAEPPSPRLGFLVLHLVCHGEAGAEHMRLLMGEGPGAPVPLALAAWFRAAALVVLDVCEAAADLPDPAEVLALAVLEHGARACLAPARPIELRATRALHAGLYEAFAQGARVSAAVAAARRTLSLEALPSAGGRWHLPRLHTRSVSAAEAAPGLGFRAEAWPNLASDATELLARGFREAEARATGWMGLEHLLLALARTPGPPVVEPLRAHVARAEERIAERLSGWLAIDTGQAMRATPRVRRIVASVRAGGGVLDLVRAVVADRGHDLDHVVGADLAATLPGALAPGPPRTLPDLWAGTLHPDGEPAPRAWDWPDLPAVALEVVGGPEDGLRLEPRPGDTVGRWSRTDGPTVPLFKDCPVTDLAMSRTLLTWHGDGSVTLKGSGRRFRAGAVEAVGPGPVELRAGDLLAPGGRVRVRFRALAE